GILIGISIVLKNNITIKDILILFGIDLFTNYIPDINTTIITRLLEVGVTIIRKAIYENLSLYVLSFSIATGLV
ncbi:hypothetical protein BGZ57DRAFT_779244, partial [Hyaloscypha finlandica]